VTDIGLVHQFSRVEELTDDAFGVALEDGEKEIDQLKLQVFAKPSDHAVIEHADGVAGKDEKVARVWVTERLFTDEQASREVCTRRSTYYCSAMLTAVTVSMYVRWLRGNAVPVSQKMDLLAGDMRSVFLPPRGDQ